MLTGSKGDNHYLLTTKAHMAHHVVEHHRPQQSGASQVQLRALGQLLIQQQLTSHHSDVRSAGQQHHGNSRHRQLMIHLSTHADKRQWVRPWVFDAGDGL